MAMQSGYTPQQAALDIAMTALRVAFKARGQEDIEIYARTDAEKKLVRAEVAKLHNKMLSESGLDGMNLEEPKVTA